MSATFILFYYLDMILYENFLPHSVLPAPLMTDPFHEHSIGHIFRHVVPVDLAHPRSFIIDIIQGYTYTQDTHLAQIFLKSILRSGNCQIPWLTMMDEAPVKLKIKKNSNDVSRQSVFFFFQSNDQFVRRQTSLSQSDSQMSCQTLGARCTGLVDGEQFYDRKYQNIYVSNHARRTKD